MDTAILVRGRVKSVRALDRSKTIEVQKWFTELTVDLDSVEPRGQSIPSTAVYGYYGRKPELQNGVRVVLHIPMIDPAAEIIMVDRIDVSDDL